MSMRYLAPSVACSLYRPKWLGTALLLMLCLIGLLLVAWLFQPQTALRHTVMASLVFVGAAIALLGVRRSWPVGRLAWSGADWRLYVSPQPGQAELADEGRLVTMAVGWDGNSWLWLRLRNADVHCGLPWWQVIKRMLAVPEVWLLLHERDSPEQWGDMRRAVYFCATQQA